MREPGRARHTHGGHMLRGIASATRLTRPLNCLSAGGCVIMGSYLSTGLGDIRSWIAAGAATLLTAAANIVNDYFDLEVDRVNKPSRVLPSGLMGRPAAARFAVALVVIGLGLSAWAGLAMALVAVLMAVLLVVYSWKLKLTFLVGQLVIGGMSAMTVVYGGMAVGSVLPTLLPAVGIFLLVFCREILKTVEDFEGDRLAGARTVAVVWGKTNALRSYAVVAVLASVVALVPLLQSNASGVYALLVIPGVDAILLISALVLLRQPSGRYVRMTLAATKAGWVLFLIAMFVGLESWP